MVSVTTVKSVNSNAPISQLVPRATYRWSSATLQFTRSAADLNRRGRRDAEKWKCL